MERTGSSVMAIAKSAARGMFRAKAKVAAMVIAAMTVAGGGTYLVIHALSGRGAAVAVPAPPARPADAAKANAEVVDWGSPVAVVEASIRCAMAPDARGFRETLTASGTDEARLADAMAEVFVVAQELNDLAKARFGLEARLGLVGSRDDMPKIDTRRWQVQIDGDVATVTTSRGLGPRVQHLRKVDGKWKVQIYETMGPAIGPGTPAADLADRLLVTASAMRRTAGELLAGRFETTEEAEEFLESQAEGKGKAGR